MKMQTKTVMESAFEDAGVDRHAVRLAAIADEILAKGQGEKKMPLRILKDDDLLQALWRFFLNARKTNELRVEDHSSFDDQKPYVQTTRLTPLPGEGQRLLDAHLTTAQPRQTHDGGGGQEATDTQINDAPSAVVPKPLIPLAKQGASAMSAIQGIMAKSITFRLHDGRNIMDAQFHELTKIERNGVSHATAFAREAFVARYLREHCTFANPNPFEKVGKYFPQKILEQAIAEADKKESAHV